MTLQRLLSLFALVCALSHSVTAQTINATKLNLSNFPFISGTKDTTLATASYDQIPSSKAVKIYADRHLAGRTVSTVAPSVGDVLRWSGTEWIPSAGSGGYVFVTANSSITAAVNTVLIGTLPNNITLGLPTCNAANDAKQFLFQKSGTDATYGMTIDPSGSEQFSDGTTQKVIFSTGIEFQCTCRYASGVGVWFFNF